MPQKCYDFVELHPKPLIHVFLPRSLPSNIFLIFSIAQLQIVLNELPIHRRRSRSLHLIVGSTSQQFSPVVFMQDMHDHRLRPADDLLPILQIRQLYRRMLLLQCWVVLLLPLVLGEEGVFLLFVRDEDVLHYHSDDLGLTSDGPVDKGQLLLLRDVLLLCQTGKLLLLGLLWLLFLLGLLRGRGLAHAFGCSVDVVALKGIVRWPALAWEDIIMAMAVHIVAHMGTESSEPSKASHPTHTSHTSHTSHASHSSHTAHSSHSSHSSHPSSHASEGRSSHTHSKSCISKPHLASKSLSSSIHIFILAQQLIFIVLIKIIIRLFLILAHRQNNKVYGFKCNHSKENSQMKLIYFIIASLFIEHYLQFYFKMQTNKRSMDQISLELTEKYIELDSRKYIPSELKLEYSKTQISIQEIPLQPQSPLLENQSHHPNNQTDKLPKLTHKHIDYTQNLYNIESPQCWQKSRLRMHQPHHPRTDRGKDSKQRQATSLIAKLPRYAKPQKMKSKSLGLKNSFPPKSGHEKENEIAYKLLKFKLEEEKRKYQSFRVTSRGSEIKKGHIGDNQIAHRGMDQNNNFLARKIKLDYNEVQEKKYLQRLIMNRQSILHISQRLMQLPAIKQQ